MKSETIVIANLKCGGCETTIKNKMKAINGVKSVFVDNDTDTVTLTYEGEIKRQVFLKKLHDLGYPEATEKNGLLLKLKSYQSCMMGKIENLSPNL
jgi:copper chaperone CopZ